MMTAAATRHQSHLLQPAGVTEVQNKFFSATMNQEPRNFASTDVSSLTGPLIGQSRRETDYQIGLNFNTTSSKQTWTFCTDDELASYQNEEFEIVNRIIELCFSKALRSAQNSVHESHQNKSEEECSSDLQITLVDKLVLIRAYEQTLRNQGLTPGEDSRIYKLLFRVVHEGEQFLTKHLSSGKRREMAMMERLSILQNQLHQLRRTSLTNNTSYEATQQHVSCLSSQTKQAIHAIDEEDQQHQTSTISAQLNHHIQKIKSRQASSSMPVIETISQIGSAPSEFRGFECVLAQQQQQIGADSVPANLGQATAIYNPKITKLNLKPTFHHQISNSEPNPVSERQIDREIVDLHLQNGIFETKKTSVQDVGQALLMKTDSFMFNGPQQQQNEGVSFQHDPEDLESSEMVPTKQVQIPPTAHYEVNLPPTNKRGGEGAKLSHVQTAQSDIYVNTTERSHGFLQHEQFSYGGFAITSLGQENASHCMSAQNDTLAKPTYNQFKRQSQSVCHATDINEQRVSRNGIINRVRVSSTKNASNRTLNLTNHLESQLIEHQKKYVNARPRLDAKKTLAFKFKVEYASVFRVFRGWSEQTQLRKRQKLLKKQLFKGLVKAIQKHEEILTKKVFRGLRRTKRANSRLKRRIQYMQEQVNRNVFAFYFRLMLKKYKERVFAQNMTSLAQSHFKSSYRVRIFQEWRQVTRKRKEFLQAKITQLRRNPQSAIVLINFLGYMIIPRRQRASFDILDFYSYCSIKKRFRPNSQRLARTIEVALKQRLRRIIYGWRDHKNLITYFKKKQRINLLRKVFLVLDKNNALNYRLKLFANRRNARLLEHSIIALLQNLERVRRLDLSTKLTNKLHQGCQLKKFFTQWHHLFSFYKAGSLVKFAQKSVPLKAIHLHKKRVFNRLKRHWIEKKEKKKRVQQFIQHRLVTLVYRSFTAWHSTKKLLMTTRLKVEQTKEKYEARIRRIFFKGMLRACMIRQRQHAYREYVLIAKGLQALAQHVDYRRMQKNMVVICHQTYLTNLCKRAFNSMKAHKYCKDSQDFLLDRARQYLAARSLQAMFVAWRDTATNLKQRKILTYEVYRFYDKKVYRRTFQTIVNYVLRRRHLQAIAQEVQNRIAVRLCRSALETIVFKYARRANLKQLQRAFIAKRTSDLEKATFLSWVQKYSHLRARELQVAQRHQVFVKYEFFTKWFSLGQQLFFDRHRINQVQGHSALQTKLNVFHELQEYTKRRAESRKYKAVSSYFFICKVLKRTILALRMHAIQSRFNQAQDEQDVPELLMSSFEALKSHWKFAKDIKQASNQIELSRGSRAMRQWFKFATSQQRRRKIILAFEQRRTISIYTAFFQSAAVSQQNLDEADTYYYGRLFKAWARRARQQVNLARKKQEVEIVHLQLMKQQALRAWHEALFTQFILNKIALPFNATVLLKTAFRSLKKVTQQRRKAQLFARRSMLCRAMQALTLHQMKEVKVNSIQINMKRRRLGTIFDAFIDQCIVRQDLRLKGEELKARVASGVCQRSWNHWFDLCQEKLHFGPIESEIKSTIREKWLLKVTFATMSRYKVIRQGKKNMYASILNYYLQMNVAKVFRQLSRNAELRAMRRDMKHDADLLYRKQQLARFIRAAHLLEQDRLEAAQNQRTKRLAIQAITGLRDHMTACQEKKSKLGQADVFSQIRLKLNVFRALAIHTLRCEKARLAATNRKTVFLSVSNQTSYQLSRGRVRAPKPAKSSLRLKAIRKIHRLSLCLLRDIVTLKTLKKVSHLLLISKGLTRGQSSSLTTRLSSKHRAQRLKKSKKQTWMKQKSPQLPLQSLSAATTLVIESKPGTAAYEQGSETQRSEDELVEMNQMIIFEEEEEFDCGGGLIESEEFIAQAKPAVIRGSRNATADRAVAPIRQPQSSQEHGETNETFGPKELYKAQQLPALKQTMTQQSVRKKPYIEEVDKEVLEIEDLKRSSQFNSSMENNSLLKIEECYEDEAPATEQSVLQKRAQTAQFYYSQESLGVQVKDKQVEPIGAHLDRLHKEEHGVDVPAWKQHNDSISYLEDKWDNFFQQYGSREASFVAQEPEEAMHTMPSFREGDAEYEKTLSIIYDDGDLARDHDQTALAIQQRYITAEVDHHQMRAGNWTQKMYSPDQFHPNPSDSIEIMAEEPKRIVTHIINAEPVQYETNQRTLNHATQQPPRRPTALHASNQEIEDEMKMYSTVQSYDKMSTAKQQLRQSSGNEWLRRTLQNRLNQSGGNYLRRSGSWRGEATQTGPTTLVMSLAGSRATSLRSSSATQIAGSGHRGKDNKVMQKIVENLNYLNLSREAY